MLLLNLQDVVSLLDWRRLIDELAPAMAHLSAGRVSQPPRIAAMVPERQGLLGVMPAYLPAVDTLAAKLVSVFPQNAAKALPTHQAVLVLFDAATGTAKALMDATAITAARTAAGSALATRYLSRPEAAALAIVGTGVQARAHALAMPLVRPVRSVRIFGRDARKAAALAQELGNTLQLPCSPVSSFREAATGADIICAATHAAAPVVLGKWLEPGVHVNSVGLHPGGRELDDETVRRSLIVVESRQAALAEGPGGANDLVQPIRNGVICAEDIHAEVGEIVSGARPGRSAPEQLTLYKSVGVAVQDAVAAQLVFDAAVKKGAGVRFEM